MFGKMNVSDYLQVVLLAGQSNRLIIACRKNLFQITGYVLVR